MEEELGHSVGVNGRGVGNLYIGSMAAIKPMWIKIHTSTGLRMCLLDHI